MVCLVYPTSYALKTYTMIQGLISKVYVKFNNTKKWQFSIVNDLSHDPKNNYKMIMRISV